MTFNSLQFFAFFGIVLIVYYRLRRSGQNGLIVVAGSVFYGAFDWRFLGLLWLSTVVDYAVGRGLGHTANASTRKLLLGVSLVTQLGILGFFKYLNFFADSASRLLESFGLNADVPTLRVILPVGISFYTFQTLAYVLYVYRGRLPPERNFVTFAAFVAWFPQMVAGPIERPNSLLPQIQRRRDLPRPEMCESAVGLMLQGLVKKVVIADSVATVVNDAYAEPGQYAWHGLAVATIAFAVQVYCDFSGYSDLARGASRLLGVELRRNFEQPFLSRNIQEFWQRWHTSLGWWFLEFVGRPLGAVRRSPRWAAFTMLVIFTLIGLWHGAAWTFVIWGTLNGAFVVMWRRRTIPKDQDPDRVRLVEAPRILFTFGLFCFGAVFFRAGSLEVALTVLERIATLRPGARISGDVSLVPVMVALALAIDLVERRRRVTAIEARGARTALGGVASPEEAVAESLIAPMGPLHAGAVVGAFLVAVVIFSGGTPTPFIYFQF